MRKSAYIVIVAAVALVAFVSGNAQAQSAKFAASWDDEVVSVEATINEMGPKVTAEELLTTIDVAQQKDLLIGVSGQIGLVTLTEAKKETDTTTLGSALASARVKVTLELRDPDTGDVIQTAAPGEVIFAARLQEIKVGGTADAVEVLVSLKLDTTAAHHFNFLGVDLIQGSYDVVAVFDLSAFVEVVGDASMANAEVVLGPRMVTVQEVRAVKGSIEALPL